MYLLRRTLSSYPLFNVMGIICHPLLCFSLFVFRLLTLLYEKNKTCNSNNNPTIPIMPRNPTPRLPSTYQTTLVTQSS